MQMTSIDIKLMPLFLSLHVNWTLAIFVLNKIYICLRKHSVLDPFFLILGPIFLYPSSRLSIKYVRLILNMFEVDWIFFTSISCFICAHRASLQSRNEIQRAESSKWFGFGRFRCLQFSTLQTINGLANRTIVLWVGERKTAFLLKWIDSSRVFYFIAYLRY